jgi:hypothetical protein
LTSGPSGLEVEIHPEVAIVAGFTSRDRVSVERHAAELRAHGVWTPGSVPAFYPVPPSLLIQDEVIATVHPRTSGEAEVALIVDHADVYVAAASDHTDREAEQLDIGLAKVACPKVIGRTAWPLELVRDHWDDLIVRSWVDDDPAPYQVGSLAELLAPDDLLERIPWSTAPSTFVVLCGTIATTTGLRSHSRFRMEVYDGHRGASLSLRYSTAVLPFLPGWPR